MSAALVRLAGVSLKLALPILLVLTFYKLMFLPPPLPSAPMALFCSDVDTQIFGGICRRDAALDINAPKSDLHPS